MPAAAPTTTALDTERLTATTLEDLNASAGLLTRIDRKYLVASDTAQGVIDALAERALVLDIDGRRCFSYASTYFDTPELGSYFQAAHKRRRRFKIRTRSYLDSGLTFLEVKTRGPRGATIKQRMDYRAADADHLTPEGLGFIADCLAPLSGSVRDARRVARSLKPVMSTTYRRTTLHLPDDGARATIDTDLTWTAFASGEDGEGERQGVGGDAEPGRQAALAGDVEQGQDGKGEDAQQEGGGAGGRAGAAAFFRGGVVVEGGVFSER